MVNEYVRKRDLARIADKVAFWNATSNRDVLWRGIYFLIALAAVLIWVFPFYWLMKIAISWPAGTMYGEPPSLVIERFNLYNFVRVYYEIDFLRFLYNSVVITLLAVSGTLVINSLAGYGLRLDFYGKRAVILFLVGALFVPTFVLILPLHILSDRLGLLNTHLGVALPLMAGIIGTFIFKHSFDAVPDSMIEAARLDGASELYIVFGVLWPMSRAAIVTNVILTFIAAWNSYLWPLVIMTDREMYPLPLALATFTNQFAGNYAVAYAFTIMVLLPAIVLFVLLQNQFIGSAVHSSLKE